jgi:hypothetical protein
MRVDMFVFQPSEGTTRTHRWFYDVGPDDACGEFARRLHSAALESTKTPASETALLDLSEYLELIPSTTTLSELRDRYCGEWS